MTPQTRRALSRLEAIRAAERNRRLSSWAEAVARIQGTPARTDDEARAKREAMEKAGAGYPGR